MVLALEKFNVQLGALLYNLGFPGGSVVKKNPPANAGNAVKMGLISALGRSSRRGNGNPLQYSCLGIPMDRGGWWAKLWGCHELAKSWTPPKSALRPPDLSD